MNPKKDLTIYDIAKQLNISTSTVSRALQYHPAINKLTKKKVIATA
jgi:LacI family transcriptional regulator